MKHNVTKVENKQVEEIRTQPTMFFLAGFLDWATFPRSHNGPMNASTTWRKVWGNLRLPFRKVTLAVWWTFCLNLNRDREYRKPNHRG